MSVGVERSRDLRVASSFVAYDLRIRVEPSGFGLSASSSQLADSFLFLGAMMCTRQRLVYASAVLPTKRVGVVQRWKCDEKGRM